jgi:hypothetical protein
MNIGPEGLQYRISGRFLRVGGELLLKRRAAGPDGAPWKASFTANVVAHARKKRNAPVELSGILPSTWRNLPGNAPATFTGKQHELLACLSPASE